MGGLPISPRGMRQVIIASDRLIPLYFWLSKEDTSIVATVKPMLVTLA